MSEHGFSNANRAAATSTSLISGRRWSTRSRCRIRWKIRCSDLLISSIRDAASWREIDDRQSAQPTLREKGMNDGYRCELCGAWVEYGNLSQVLAHEATGGAARINTQSDNHCSVDQPHQSKPC